MDKEIEEELKNKFYPSINAKSILVSRVLFIV